MKRESCERVIYFSGLTFTLSNLIHFNLLLLLFCISPLSPGSSASAAPSAFALASNMPGPNKKSYISATLSICITTTVLFGGVTERILTRYGMKQSDVLVDAAMGIGREGGTSGAAYDLLVSGRIKRASETSSLGDRMSVGVKGLWRRVDRKYLNPLF